jgi:outer membrane biosynthesis protein TonB
MRIHARTIVLSIALPVLAALSGALAQKGGTIADKDINVVDYVDLSYPPIAVLAHVQGVVVVRLKLDDQGKVLDAEALSGTPLLTGPSVDNAKKWRFEPNSQKAAVIVYNFRIEGDCHYSSGSSSQVIFYPPNLAAITACPGPTQP